MTVAVFLVLGILPVRGEECDPIALSFKLCDSDRTCRSRLFIDENGPDMDVFTFLYNRILSSSDIRGDVKRWLCQHPNATRTCHRHRIDYDDLDDFFKLWIVFITKYRFCNHVNEYFDGILRVCVCKQDKVCTTVHPIDMEFHSANYQVLIWVAIGVVVALSLNFIKRNRTQMQMLNDIKFIMGAS
jgi:hypothetical protein